MPKSEKGRNCRHALEFFSTSDRVWAETKYDGERAQIHVEVHPNTKSNITIFSKSKRDSTMDRYGIHAIIRQALGLSNSQQAPQIKRNVILDAEMVACHGHGIDGMRISPYFQVLWIDFVQSSGGFVVLLNKPHMGSVESEKNHIQNLFQARK